MRIPLREFPFTTEDKGGQGQGVKNQLLTRYYFSYSFRYSISCDIANFFTTHEFFVVKAISANKSYN